MILYYALGTLFFAGYTFRQWAGNQNYPCALTDFGPFISVSFCFLTTLLRIGRYYYKVKLNRELADQAYEVAKETYNFGSILKKIPVDEHEPEAADNLVCEFPLKSKVMKPFHQKHKESFPAVYDGTAMGIGNLEDEVEQQKKPFLDALDLGDGLLFIHESYDHIKAYRRFQAIVVSGRIILFVIVALSVIFVGTVALDRITCFGCDRLESLKLGFSAFGILSLVAMLAAYQSIRKEKDYIGIKKELRRSVLLFLLPAFLFAVLDRFDPCLLFQNGFFDWVFFCHLGLVLGYSEITVHQLVIAQSLEKRRKAVQEGQLSELEKLLSDETGRKLFKTYLVSAMAVENYYFWRDVTQWKQHYEHRTAAELSREFEYMKKTYVQQSAPLRLNCSDAQYQTVLTVDVNELLRRNEKVDMKVFDLLYTEILHALNGINFTEFKSTPMYVDYTMHLNSTQRI